MYRVTNFSTKAKCWKELITVRRKGHTVEHRVMQYYSGCQRYRCSRVIVLADGSHGHERLHVLVRFGRTDIVERRGLGGVSVAAGKVHTYCEIDLTATHYIIQEGVELGDL